MKNEVRRITFKVMRFDPERDEKPRYEEYTLPLKKGMTILDGLIFLKENQDSTLSFRASCRMGVCGSCAVLADGLPRLACQTQIDELGKDEITLEPIPNFPIIKDIVPDLMSFFDSHARIKPYVLRGEGTLEREMIQSPKELEDFLQFSYCIKCGICVSVCPTFSTDERFLGPQALTQVYRYCADTRDEGFEERKRIVDTSHGVWRCHFAGECSHACPKGVDPALAIQLLKRALLFGLRKKKADVAPPLVTKRREGIPEAPKPTVG